MDYIVLDLEWNQSGSKRAQKPGLPFEIIELGAVKLNDQREVVDSYTQIIKPAVYKTLFYRTTELTGITQKEVDAGADFGEAIMDFLFWCGEDYMFCTWGNLDLLELQRNLKHYKILDLLPGPVKYLNLQKIFKLFYSEDQQNSSLENAVSYFGISSEGHFHRAVNDALYTAKVFQQMNLQDALANYTVDYYQYPMWKRQELHLKYEHYYKYISRGYDTREQAFADKEVRSTRCYICQKNAAKKIRWFASKTKGYYSLAICPEHGWLRCKIRLKKMDDGRVVAIKTIRPADEDTIQVIRQMKKEVLKKRQERRQGQKGNM